MRNSVISELVELAQADKQVWLLTGDVGYSVVEPFAERFPTRFLNVGIAEQNMIGVAAGLALSGKKVFLYSISNFLSIRCLEQIRNDVCYHTANVKIVTVGGGFTYGSQGYTHHGLEDIAVIRTLPNMAVIAPGDANEARWAVRQLHDWSGPAFLRLGKVPETPICSNPDKFVLGKILSLSVGKEVTLLSTGNMLYTAYEVNKQLQLLGFDSGVASVHTLKPLDKTFLSDLFIRCRLICTIEEHGSVGGLGDAVCHIAATLEGHQARILTFSVDTEATISSVGGTNFLREKHGLTPEHILNQILQAIKS